MKQFEFSFLMGLRNDEFPQFFNQLSSLLEEESVVDVYVKECLEDVNAHLEELKFVMNMRNPHPLTAKLEEQIVVRKTSLVSLRGKVFASLKSPIAAEREAATVLAGWIDKHCKGKLYSPSIIVHTRMVDNLKQDYTMSEAIAEAIEVLALSPVFDSICAISHSINRDFMTRNDEQAADVRKAFLIRSNAYKSLKKYFKALDLALSLEKGTDHFYLDYCRRIDKLLDNYRVRYLSRNTRRKNAAQKAEDEKQNAEPENGEQDGGGIMTMNLKGGKPAMAGGMKTFGATSLDGMDLQNGTTNGSLEGKLAMNGNGTNGAATNGADEKIIDPTAGAGDLLNKTFWDSQEDATDKHEGAKHDDSDQNRGMNNLDS